jgi:hypothetical protein
LLSNALFCFGVHLYNQPQSLKKPSLYCIQETKCDSILFLDSLQATQQRLYVSLVNDRDTSLWGERHPPNGYQFCSGEEVRYLAPKHAISVLDDCSEQGSATLAAAIASESALSAGIVNYNRSQNKTFQAGDKSSIMHKGTVMYIGHNMLPCLTFGSRLFNTFAGSVFTIVESQKMSPYHQLVNLCLLYISLPMPCTAIERFIKWRNSRYTLLSLFGTQSKPKLSYLDQMIPSPLNLHIPQSWIPDDILFRWIPTMGSKETLCRLSVDDYWLSWRLLEFFETCTIIAGIFPILLAFATR